MTSISTGWQRLGAALFALVLTVLTFGPGIDAMLCRDDAGMSAAAAEHVHAGSVDTAQPHVDAAPSDGDFSDHGPDGMACIHGHCHHGASYVPAQVRSPGDIAAVATRHELRRSRVAVLDRKFALKRPPRA
jgi:hypothetical protein